MSTSYSLLIDILKNWPQDVDKKSQIGLKTKNYVLNHTDVVGKKSDIDVSY
jgi:hypothetical protein